MTWFSRTCCLALAMIGWAGIRAATLGALPGAEIFQINRSEAKPRPVIATEFPPIEAIEPAVPGAALADFAPAATPYPQVVQSVRPVVIPIYYAGAAPPPIRPAALRNVLPEPAPQFYSPIPALDDWPLSRIAASSMPAMRPSVARPGQSTPVALRSHGIDRLQLTAWALLRSQQGGIGPRSLANGGTLGASQAGARLNYNITRQIAATVRTTSDVGRRGGEVAAGMRVQPLGGVPVWFTAERRQRIGAYGGGRNAFALFAEGGVYDRPMPWHFSLDAYLQGGMVGLHHRDRFIDGGLTFTRPIYKQYSAGFGVWGGAQPGVYRLDAGPRVTMRVRNNVRVHVDWRQRLVGNARPTSGPALTLAGDF